MKQYIDNICFYIPLKKLRNSIRWILEKICSVDNKTNILEEKLYYQELRIEKINNIVSDMILYKDDKKIFYLQTPEHGNIGDHAIVYSSQQIINNIYPNYILLEYTYNDFYYIFSYIKKWITKEDIIFLPGGGNLGNLYPNEEEIRREILRSFYNNKIFMFPVSINYDNTDDGQLQLNMDKEVFSNCSNLQIMTRDKNSYDFANIHFINNKIFLIPDIALYLSTHFYNELKNISENNREGCLFLLRNDKEKVTDDVFINKIKTKIEKQNIQIYNFDTFSERDIKKDEREFIILDTLKLISKYKVCITDRFHGMIFSILTNTPCIVFDSLDKKIMSGYKWFENIDYVNYISKENLKEEDVYYILDKYLNNNYNHNIIFDFDFLENIKNIVRNLDD